MDKRGYLELMRGVSAGEVSPEEAVKRLQIAPFDDLGFAKVDHHRGVRQGTGEVIYGAGKTPEQILAIVKNMLERGSRDILVTRMDAQAANALQGEFDMEYHEAARVGVVAKDANKTLRGSVVVASGGTSDMAVCEEAAITAETLGSKVTRLYDVGVSGLHRLMANMENMVGARVVVAVAGMEGALASVIGGLVSCPVIAVPTSVGYGANFGGVAALLAMLNSCASGVSVVNIDNGFGAGYLANMINQMEGVE